MHHAITNKPTPLMYRLKREDDTDIEFSGFKIAEASSRNQPGQLRWTTITLYETTGGTYVCQTIGHSKARNEYARHHVALCDDPQDVIAYFGHGWLAKDLYSRADFNVVTHVA